MQNYRIVAIGSDVLSLKINTAYISQAAMKLDFNKSEDVLYQIDLVEDKAAFREALLTDGIAVIYNGHARYGRGPCFGPPGNLPGDDWENGAAPDTAGIFRMGYPFVGIPGHEIIGHGSGKLNPKFKVCAPLIQLRKSVMWNRSYP